MNRSQEEILNDRCANGFLFRLTSKFEKSSVPKLDTLHKDVTDANKGKQLALARNDWQVFGWEEGPPNRQNRNTGWRGRVAPRAQEPCLFQQHQLTTTLRRVKTNVPRNCRNGSSFEQLLGCLGYFIETLIFRFIF